MFWCKRVPKVQKQRKIQPHHFQPKVSQIQRLSQTSSASSKEFTQEMNHRWKRHITSSGKPKERSTWLRNAMIAMIAQSAHKDNHTTKRKPKSLQKNSKCLTEHYNLWEKQKHYADHHTRYASRKDIGDNVRMWENNHHWTPVVVRKSTTPAKLHRGTASIEWNSTSTVEYSVPE